MPLNHHQHTTLLPPPSLQTDKKLLNTNKQQPVIVPYYRDDEEASSSFLSSCSSAKSTPPLASSSSLSTSTSHLPHLQLASDGISPSATSKTSPSLTTATTPTTNEPRSSSSDQNAESLQALFTKHYQEDLFFLSSSSDDDSLQDSDNLHFEESEAVAGTASTPASPAKECSAIDISKYRDVHRHPNATPQTIIPAKKLNKYHFLGLGLSTGLTALAVSKLGLLFCSSSKLSSIAKISSLFTGVSLSVWSSMLLIRWNFFMLPKQVQNESLKKEYKIEASSSPLDPRLLLSGSQIAQDLRDGKYTSVEICKLFIDQIEKYNDKHINTVCFRRYGTALKEATECDKKLEQWRNSGRTFDLPPFFGVPCTVKESFQLLGTCCTSGHPARVGNMIDDIEDQSPAVTRYQKNGGAVIICTTNVSELCMWLESYSVEELHGTTCNPYDSRCIVGGSTGGEAAAISSLFAPFGLGGDFGGSLRLPSFFCGIFTHKPSTRLITNQGQHPNARTHGHLMTCTGPMARNVEDLFPLLQVLQTGGNGLDDVEEEKKFFELNKDEFPPCPQVPTSPSLPSHKDNFASLTIYVCEDLNLPFVTVDPQQKLATRTVCEEFAKKTGCKLHFVDFTKPETVPAGWSNFSRAIELWSACSSAQPVSYVKLLQNKKRIPLDENFNEQHDEELEKSPNNYSYSVFGEMFKWLLGISNHTFPSIGLGIIETLHHTFIPDDDNEKSIAAARLLTKQVGDDVLGDNGVLVCPTYTRPAPQHHALKVLTPDFAYCALFNALQLPSTQVPVWLDANNDNQQQQKLPLGLQIISKWGNDLLSLQVASGFAKQTPYVYHRVPEWMC